MCPGRSYSVFSQRTLNQCLESLVQKIQSGVVIKFEKTGPDPPPLEGKRLLVPVLRRPPTICCSAARSQLLFAPSLLVLLVVTVFPKSSFSF